MEKGETEYANKFTSRFGFPSERAATKVKDTLSEPIKQFISESPFLVMATSSRDGKCDASPKEGKPGFVLVLNDRHLLVPDVAGNKLFQSYLNMDENPYVGRCFFIPGLADVVRVNGPVTFVDREDLDRHDVERSMYDSDGNRGVQPGILVEVEESFGHCPRSLSYSGFWDLEEIQKRQGTARAVRMRPASPASPGTS